MGKFLTQIIKKKFARTLMNLFNFNQFVISNYSQLVNYSLRNSKPFHALWKLNFRTIA